MAKDDKKMFKVTINSGESDSEQGDVVLGHNFKLIQIMRDQEVTISEDYLNCLKDSVIETTVKDDKGNDKVVKIPRFSFSVTPV